MHDIRWLHNTTALHFVLSISNIVTEASDSKLLNLYDFNLVSLPAIHERVAVQMILIIFHSHYFFERR